MPSKTHSDANKKKTDHSAASWLGDKLRRLSHTTAMAFGVASDTDFDDLRVIQRQWTDKQAGITKGDKVAEQLLQDLAMKAGVTEDKMVEHHNRKHVKNTNRAFQDDLRQYQTELTHTTQHQNTRASPHKRGYSTEGRNDSACLFNGEKDMAQKYSQVSLYENIDGRREARQDIIRFCSSSQQDSYMSQTDVWGNGGIVTSATSQCTESRTQNDTITIIQHDNERALKNPTFMNPVKENASEEKSSKQMHDDDNKSRDNCLLGREAYYHYLQYTDQERVAAYAIMNRKNHATRKDLMNQKQQIEDALEAAKDHYSQTRSKNQSVKERMKKMGAIFDKNQLQECTIDDIKKDNYQALIRTQLESVKLYTPWCLYLITVLQSIAVTVLLILGKVTTVGINPTRLVSEQLTWGGRQEVVYYTLPNLWIGPQQENLIHFGAIFAPCLRTEKSIIATLFKYQMQTELGCCEITGIGAGTTTENECSEIAVVYKIPDFIWRNGSTCTQRGQYNQGETHVFRPCCYGLKGDCQLLAQGHCDLLKGHWYSGYIEHCSQTQCHSTICDLRIRAKLEEAMTEGTDPDTQKAQILGETDINYNNKQLWRIPLSLFYHQGVIHVVLVSMAQLLLGVQVERTAGWHRVAFIYMTSGMGGLLAGCIMRPYEATVGGNGAVTGLIAVHIVELAQTWKFLHKPHIPLLKLLILLIIMTAAGMLPQTNQYVQVCGFVIGLLAAIICLPYITFNYWHSTARIILICVSLLLLLAIVSALVIAFYTFQLHEIKLLSKLNCLSFFPLACNHTLP